MSRLLKIGLFFLITTAGTVVYMMRTADTIDAKSTYMVEVLMDDASGIFVDSNIRMAGVSVGKVRSIQLAGGKAKLVLELSSDVQLFDDARVVKSIESMLGVSALSIYPGVREEIPLRAGGMIQNSVSSNLMDETFLGASEVAGEATLLIKELRKFLSEDGGYNTLKDILDTARDATRNTSVLVDRNLVLLTAALQDITEITGRLNRSSRDDVDRLSEILKNTSSITERIDRLLAENDRDLTDSLAGIKDSIAKLNATLDEVGGVTAKINSGQGNLGKLVHDDKLYDRVIDITGRVEDYVNSTFGMELQVAFQSDLLVNRLESRNRFGLRLTPKSGDKFYSIGFVDTPRFSEKTVTTTTVISGSDPPVGTDYITYETERKNRLLLNAQIARRFGLFTLRGGVLESTGGLGVDFQPHRGVELSAEMFDFGQNKGPYLRAFGTIYPFFNPALANPLNWLYLSGGADNILTEERDYFIGLGLRFTDNDLKGIAGFIPTR